LYTYADVIAGHQSSMKTIVDERDALRASNVTYAKWHELMKELGAPVVVHASESASTATPTAGSSSGNSGGADVTTAGSSSGTNGGHASGGAAAANNSDS